MAFGYRNEYDLDGNKIYYENSNGYWEKYEHESDGRKIYYKTSGGFWSKSEYDSELNKIYYENSYGDWVKREFDSEGNEIYYEDSDGVIKDNRPKIEDGFIVTHFGGLKDIVILNGIKYKRIDQ
jgi:hypothetical protein